MKSIVFFDGYCHLCQASVQFILKRDRQAKFCFAPLDSQSAKQYLKNHPDLYSCQTLVLWTPQQIYTQSQAALEILSELPWPWPLLQIGYLFPRCLRDKIYRWISKNRYLWFGKSQECFLPKKEWQDRFLN
ncbi:MAG: DUF393 domain-containing protein [Deltaproteobacteria bacterium]|nr:DUF393 domain-containing protein [Deltaproteobacteria bacterium]